MHVNVPVVLVVLCALHMCLGLIWRFAILCLIVILTDSLVCLYILCVSFVFVGDA